MRCCGLAEIPTKTPDAEGRLVEHADLHSLRRTFAASLISSGADPKSVQELLGRRTLDMTTRQALTELSYGKGVLAPEGVLPYPGAASIPVQNGHQSVTGTERAAGG
jgi:integrase